MYRAWWSVLPQGLEPQLHTTVLGQNQALVHQCWPEQVSAHALESVTIARVDGHVGVEAAAIEPGPATACSARAQNPTVPLLGEFGESVVWILGPRVDVAVKIVPVDEGRQHDFLQALAARRRAGGPARGDLKLDVVF